MVCCDFSFKILVHQKNCPKSWILATIPWCTRLEDTFVNFYALYSFTGYYMYIETSLPRKPNDKAWFLSPQYPAAPNGKCLNFWYHMSGSHIGTMNVYIKDGLTIGTKVWNETGDQGNFWLHARAPIKINNKFQVRCFIHAVVLFFVVFSMFPCHFVLVFNISSFS